MANAVADAEAFCREVAVTGVMWTIEDSGGHPAMKTKSGARAQPFWSSKARAESVIKKYPAYGAFTPVEVSWPDFRDAWARGLEGDGHVMAVNWENGDPTGYDHKPTEIARRIDAIELQMSRSTF